MGDKALSAEEIAAYRADGAAVLRGVFSRAWIAALGDGVDANIADPGPMAHNYGEGERAGDFFGDYCNWRRFAAYREFVERSNLGAVAAALMGAREVRFFHEHVLVKEPGAREVTPWHHDLPYYCVDGEQVMSLWIPLDPVPRRACPEFVASSHLWPELFYPRRFLTSEDYADYVAGGGDRYASIPDIDADRASHRILAWDLEPGDAIAFTARTVHGAPATIGVETRRRGFAARLFGDGVVYARRPGETSPPFPELSEAKAPGDPIDHELFPIIWRQGDAAAAA